MSLYPWPTTRGPVPHKAWSQAIEVLDRFHVAGKAWVAGGRPRGGPLDDALHAAEAEYSPMADYVLLRADLTDEQRAEWARVSRYYDPDPATVTTEVRS